MKDSVISSNSSPITYEAKFPGTKGQEAAIILQSFKNHSQVFIFLGSHTFFFKFNLNILKFLFIQIFASTPKIKDLVQGVIAFNVHFKSDGKVIVDWYFVY